MRSWLKKILKEALAEIRREPRELHANRPPTENDTQFPEQSTWTDRFNTVWKLSNKKSVWEIDKEATTRCRERAQSKYKEEICPKE